MLSVLSRTCRCDVEMGMYGVEAKDHMTDDGGNELGSPSTYARILLNALNEKLGAGRIKRTENNPSCSTHLASMRSSCSGESDTMESLRSSFSDFSLPSSQMDSRASSISLSCPSPLAARGVGCTDTVLDIPSDRQNFEPHDAAGFCSCPSESQAANSFDARRGKPSAEYKGVGLAKYLQISVDNFMLGEDFEQEQRSLPSQTECISGRGAAITAESMPCRQIDSSQECGPRQRLRILTVRSLQGSPVSSQPGTPKRCGGSPSPGTPLSGSRPGSGCSTPRSGSSKGGHRGPRARRASKSGVDRIMPML